jgi:hypothetical protein
MYSKENAKVLSPRDSSQVEDNKQPDISPEDLKIITETSLNDLQFNVMPERPVHETLKIKEYRVADGYIESIFDRSYSSSMLKSPDHFIFLSGLIQAQKLAYILLCHEFGLPYEADGPEQFKIWPVNISNISIPKLIRKKTDLTQKLWRTDFKKLGPNTYLGSGMSDVEGQMQFDMTTYIKRI